VEPYNKKVIHALKMHVGGGLNEVGYDLAKGYLDYASLELMITKYLSCTTKFGDFDECIAWGLTEWGIDYIYRFGSFYGGFDGIGWMAFYLDYETNEVRCKKQTDYGSWPDDYVVYKKLES
jgi:hypothetical protein